MVVFVYMILQLFHVLEVELGVSGFCGACEAAAPGTTLDIVLSMFSKNGLWEYSQVASRHLQESSILASASESPPVSTEMASVSIAVDTVRCPLATSTRVSAASQSCSSGVIGDLDPSCGCRTLISPKTSPICCTSPRTISFVFCAFD